MILLGDNAKSRVLSIIAIPNPVSIFLQTPASRAPKKPNPGSQKSYWGPSLSHCVLIVSRNDLLMIQSICTHLGEYTPMKDPSFSIQSTRFKVILLDVKKDSNTAIVELFKEWMVWNCPKMKSIWSIFSPSSVHFEMTQYWAATSRLKLRPLYRLFPAV